MRCLGFAVFLVLLGAGTSAWAEDETTPVPSALPGASLPATMQSAASATPSATPAPVASTVTPPLSSAGISQQQSASPPPAEGELPPVQAGVVVSSSAANDEALPEGTIRRTLMYGERKRSYLLHIPKNLKAGLSSLVFALAPEGVSALKFSQMTNFSGFANQQGFVVAYPEEMETGKGWNTGADQPAAYDLKFIQDIILDAAVLRPISARTIYAAGLGSGAQMAARLACIVPDTFAAIAPVASNYPQWRDCVKRPISAMIFHGKKDQVTPYEGKGLTMGPLGYAERIALQNKCPNGPGEAFRANGALAIGWGNCAARTEIIMFTLDNLAHDWPGADPASTTAAINATSMIWQFFKTHQQMPYKPPREARR